MKLSIIHNIKYTYHIHTAFLIYPNWHERKCLITNYNVLGNPRAICLAVLLMALGLPRMELQQQLNTIFNMYALLSLCMLWSRCYE